MGLVHTRLQAFASYISRLQCLCTTHTTGATTTQPKPTTMQFTPLSPPPPTPPTRWSTPPSLPHSPTLPIAIAADTVNANPGERYETSPQTYKFAFRARMRCRFFAQPESAEATSASRDLLHGVKTTCNLGKPRSASPKMMLQSSSASRSPQARPRWCKLSRRAEIRRSHRDNCDQTPALEFPSRTHGDVAHQPDLANLRPQSPDGAVNTESAHPTRLLHNDVHVGLVLTAS